MEGRGTNRKKKCALRERACLSGNGGNVLTVGVLPGHRKVTGRENTMPHLPGERRTIQSIYRLKGIMLLLLLIPATQAIVCPNSKS